MSRGRGTGGVAGAGDGGGGVSRVLSAALVAPIRLYQRWISPAWPATCRFYPSCSSYAVEALRTRGALIGSYLAVRRLVKCAPWHPGGEDPVPPPRTGARSVTSPPVRQEPNLVS